MEVSTSTTYAVLSVTVVEQMHGQMLLFAVLFLHTCDILVANVCDIATRRMCKPLVLNAYGTAMSLGPAI